MLRGKFQPFDEYKAGGIAGESMSVFVNYNNEIIIPRCGIKTFVVTVRSDEAVDVFLRFDGIGAICYNCQGKNYLGESFEKTVYLEKNTPHVFRCAASADGCGRLIVCDGAGNVLYSGGIKAVRCDEGNEEPFSDANSLNRIAWLNSDIGIDHSVPEPFVPVKRLEKSVKILGREVFFDELGLPSDIISYFNKGAKICGRATHILSDKIQLLVGNERFSNISVNGTTYEDKADIICVNESENFTMHVEANAEFDGFIGYKISLLCKKDIRINDVALRLPVNRDCLKYFIGLGKKGGLFDGNINWKWDENFNQDGFWTGDVNAGLKIKFKGANYVKPFVNIYYNHRRLNRPESWDNAGKGGIRFEDDCFYAYSGERRIKSGESLRFDFDLLITPFKEIDLSKQFSMRFFHTMFDSETWLERAKAGGANIINVHHGNDLNPFINYPFAEECALKDFVAKAHESGIKVKVYYTIRELTVNMPEFKFFRELGYEILAGRNKNTEVASWQKEAEKWINENVGADVIPAWRQPLKGRKYKGFYDSAVITEGQSRLCNFYAEGLDYLIKKTDIDGIYIDDVAYDRTTMKRVRKILDQKETAFIDFHQWNHYTDIAGRGNCAVMYAELYPYVDKCWIGEGFDYDETPEFWLIETSGIPFGVMSEMMDTGNQYRGLLFGMTNRFGWETNESSPFAVWKIFDDYKLGESELIGWWDDRNEVTLSDGNVRASEYRIFNERYVAIANFSDKTVKTEISVDGVTDCFFRRGQRIVSYRKT